MWRIMDSHDWYMAYSWSLYIPRQAQLRWINSISVSNFTHPKRSIEPTRHDTCMYWSCSINAPLCLIIYIPAISYILQIMNDASDWDWPLLVWTTINLWQFRETVSFDRKSIHIPDYDASPTGDNYLYQPSPYCMGTVLGGLLAWCPWGWHQLEVTPIGIRRPR